MRNNDLTPSQAAELEVLAAMPDEDIDTSDIPKITQFSNPQRGVFAGSPNVKLETKSQLITRFKQRDYDVLIIMSLTDLDTTDTSCGATKPGGPMHLSVADASMSESSDRRKYISFIVTLDRRADAEVTVDYTTVNGTAIAGQDYEATSGTLVFDQGEDSKTVDVPIEYDSNDEDDETLTFVLSNARGAQIEDSVATGTIVDYE